MSETTLPGAVSEILSFWFGDDSAQPLARSERWFQPNADFDREVESRFASMLEKAPSGAFDDWKQTSRPTLAFIILLDQFSRNIYRDDMRAFHLDEMALDCCLRGLERGLEASLTLVERWFFVMPLMHAEALEIQNRSVERFLALAVEAEGEGPLMQEALAGTLVFAARHREVIARFGRFPHRNALLGRETTPEESKFMEEHGQGF